MSWATDFHFTVEPTPKPEADKFMPKGGWGSVMPPVSPWTAGAISSQQPVVVQEYQTDENLKKLFGIELAKTANPFDAGCKLFGEETSKALWVSFHWMTDPVVAASKDAYLKTLELSLPPLDREQLAAKVLALAEGEKVLTERGIKVSTIEAKDRIAAFKLYSEILGYTGKVEIDNSTKTFNHNELKVVLVKAEPPKPALMNEAPNGKSEILNANTSLPVSLKLVKAS